MRPEEVDAELVQKAERDLAFGICRDNSPEPGATCDCPTDAQIRVILAAVPPEYGARVLEVEGVALVLKAHRRDGRKSWAPRVVCVCGWVGESVDHETHIAAALHVARLREGSQS